MLGTQKIPRIPASAATAIVTSGKTNPPTNTTANTTVSPGTFTWRNLASQALFTGARTFIAAKDGDDAAIQALGSGIGQYLGNSITGQYSGNGLADYLIDRAGQGVNALRRGVEDMLTPTNPAVTTLSPDTLARYSVLGPDFDPFRESRGFAENLKLDLGGSLSTATTPPTDMGNDSFAADANYWARFDAIAAQGKGVAISGDINGDYTLTAVALANQQAQQKAAKQADQAQMQSLVDTSFPNDMAARQVGAGDTDDLALSRLDLSGPGAETRKTYLRSGNPDVETGQFSRSVFSKESLLETRRDNFSADAELKLFSTDEKSILFESKLPQTTFGDDSFGMTMGAHLLVTSERSLVLTLNNEGLNFKVGRGIRLDNTYYSGQARGDYGDIQFSMGTVGEAQFESQFTLGYSPRAGVKADLGLSGDLGAAAFKVNIKGTTADMDLGLLNLSLEGTAEGHLVGAGISGNIGVKTLDNKPGVRAYIGAGLTALVGGKLNLSADVSISPRVLAAYDWARSATADLYEKVLWPYNP